MCINIRKTFDLKIKHKLDDEDFLNLITMDYPHSISGRLISIAELFDIDLPDIYDYDEYDYDEYDRPPIDSED